MIATKRKKIGKPLKYPGGKGHCADQLLVCRPPHFTEFRDVFCGSSPFLFRPDIIPLSMPRWINDKDEPLVNFFVSLRDDDSFIPRFLELKRHVIGHAERTLDAFEESKADYRTNGVSYLFLRRFALNQVVRESRPNIASVSFDYLSDPAMLKPFTKGRMEAWRKVLADVRITCGDYGTLLDAPVKRGRVCWLFVDPPYWSNMFKNRGEEIYEHVLDGESHERLRDMLAALNPKTHPFLLTLCDSEMSHTLYGVDSRFHVYDRRVIYGMMVGNVERKVIREIVVTNFRI